VNKSDRNPALRVRENIEIAGQVFLLLSLREPNQPLLPCQDILNILLHATKLDEVAAFAFQVIKHGR
jgi:hypothetical protein